MSSSFESARKTTCLFHSHSFVVGVFGSAWKWHPENGKQRSITKENWNPSSVLAPLQGKVIIYWTNNSSGLVSISVSLSLRIDHPGWYVNEFAKDACCQVVVELCTISREKNLPSVYCILTTSSRLLSFVFFAHQQRNKVDRTCFVCVPVIALPDRNLSRPFVFHITAESFDMLISQGNVFL